MRFLNSIGDGFTLRVLAGLLTLSFGWAELKGEDAPVSPEKSRVSLAVEALSRLENTDLSTNPKLKEAVYRILGQVRGTPDFLTLVKKFKLPQQQEGLVELASRRGGDETGAEAVRQVLVAGDGPYLQEAVTRSGTNVAVAIPLIQAMGAAGDGRVVPLVVPLVTDLTRPVELRKASVQALVKYQDGAAQLVRLAAEEKLPPDLRFVARSELSVVRWPDIKAAAAKALPAPEGQGSQPLPALSELLKRRGDPDKGKLLFFGKATCSTCHQIQGQGVNFGPDLSQVGTKLGKDAIYESILDPSAGIAFGYEAWLVTLKSGDEAFGLIASDTETDLSIKAPGGVVSSYKKSEIAKREKQALSVMPAGLQAVMTTEELVELVEFLVSLKKPN